MALAKTFEKIEATSSRLEIIKILAGYFVSAINLSPDDLIPSRLFVRQSNWARIRGHGAWCSRYVSAKSRF